MTQALIRKAFETRLDIWSGIMDIAIAWENVEFKPVDGEPYARAFLIPGKTEHLFLDHTGRDYVGVFQVNLHMPLGTGPGATEALVESLDNTFNGSFVQDSIRVTLMSPMSAAAPLPVPDRFVVPVSADYRVVT